MLEIRQLQAERDKAGQVCKDSKRILNSKRSKGKQIRHALGERSCWQQLGGETEAEPSDAAIKSMIEGEEPPWAGPVGPVAMLMHGRFLHVAGCDVERCSEELQILRVEQARLREWVTYMVGQVDIAVAECAMPLAAMPHNLSLAEVMGKVAVPLYGKWCCLMRLRNRLQAMNE